MKKVQCFSKFYFQEAPPVPTKWDGRTKYPKSPPTYVAVEGDDWGWREGEIEQDLPELDKESKEEEDLLTFVLLRLTFQILIFC